MKHTIQILLPLGGIIAATPAYAASKQAESPLRTGLMVLAAVVVSAVYVLVERTIKKKKK